MNRKGQRGREKEKTAGQFRIHHNNPADLDKLSLRSGANLQREMSNCKVIDELYNNYATPLY